MKLNVRSESKVLSNTKSKVHQNKDRNSNPNNPAKLGEIIDYSITVTNTGNVTLNNVDITDDKLGLNTRIPELSIGKKEIFNLSYKVSEGDLCGNITNIVKANATDPCGNTLNDTDRWNVPTIYTAAIQIDKSADVSSAKPGDVINYTYNVTNTGNVNLSVLEIKDDKLGLIDTAINATEG